MEETKNNSERHKTGFEQIKKGIPFILTWWVNTIKLSNFDKFIYKVGIPIKISTDNFLGLEKLTAKFLWKNKHIRITRKVWKRNPKRSGCLYDILKCVTNPLQLY